MKLNKRVEATFDKMTSLKIPIKKRREYIEKVYIWGFGSYTYPYVLNKKLSKLIKNETCSEKAVSSIDEMFHNIMQEYL